MNDDTRVRIKNGLYAFIGSLTTLTSVLVSEMDSEDVPRMTRAFFKVVVPISAFVGLAWGASSKGEDPPETAQKDLRDTMPRDVSILVKKINEKRKFEYRASETSTLPVSTRPSSIFTSEPRRDEIPERPGYYRTYHNGRFAGYRKPEEVKKEPISYGDLTCESSLEDGFDPIEELDRMDREYAAIVGE